MKYLLYTFILFTLHIHAQENNPKNISHIVLHEMVGDVNGDGQKDTAKIEFNRVFDQNDGFKNDCGRPVCEVKTTFGENIDPIVFEAMNIKVSSVIDVNGDKNNEILFYRWWYECCWVTLDLYSYKTGKWEIIATSKAYMSGNKDDYKDRVESEDRIFYLTGQKWNDDSSDIIPDRVPIR